MPPSTPCHLPSSPVPDHPPAAGQLRQRGDLRQPLHQVLLIAAHCGHCPHLGQGGGGAGPGGAGSGLLAAVGAPAAQHGGVGGVAAARVTYHCAVLLSAPDLRPRSPHSQAHSPAWKVSPWQEAVQERLARQEGSSTQAAWGVRGEGCEDWGQQRGLTISRAQCCSLHASALSTVGQWSMGPVPPPPPPPSRQLSSAARLEAASSRSASVYMMCSVCWCTAVLRHPDDDWHVISVKMFGICKKQPDKFPWGRSHIFSCG